MDKFFSKVVLKKTLLFLFIAFILIQFYRPGKNNSVYTANNDFLELSDAPTDIGALLKKSCYDCHSNNTNYKWFDNIAPVSWWVDNTISRGKLALNFSEWKDHDPWRKLSFLSASVYDIQTDRMPKELYIKLRPETKLSKKEKERIINWINNIDRFETYYKNGNH
ncbi:heme-binding domain-containing protein [Aquimarina sediminis]|uniref:heme-binding domain-containing protein n=1 Tax=Aquimarina sediminis TaxID=2070536 RepID=UPI000CA06A56|nr:heme-binding domain-containing protein [Aquimarina sediminis]